MPEVGMSVLLCTFNGASRLPRVLSHLAEQNIRANIPWEVILVDNASTDDTSSVAINYWKDLGATAELKVFYEPKPGKPAALKIAHSQASFTYICIVDDDNFLNTDYLQLGFDILHNNERIGILGGRNDAAFDSNAPDWFSAFQGIYAVGTPEIMLDGKAVPMPDGEVKDRVLWGAGMFMRNSVWHEMNYYGFKSLFEGRKGESVKSLVGGEDDEICYVAKLLGYKIWYCSDLFLIHYMTPSRLNFKYCIKLYYSSANVMTRLYAYQNALLNKYNQSIILLILKDASYTALPIIKQIVSMRYFKALLLNKKNEIMNFNKQVIVLLDFVLKFKLVFCYYRQVKEFQKRIKSSNNFVV
ncbi:glycosyltransferase [Hymenobacter tenuis]